MDRKTATVASSTPGRLWEHTKAVVRSLFSHREAIAVADYESVRGLFAVGLTESLKETPVESGVRNPAEFVLRSYLELYSRHAPEWIRTIILGSGPVSIRADVLVCLGRLPHGLIHPWGFDVAREALQSDAVEMRDAAVRALELWGVQKSVEILRFHASTRKEISWLAEYVRRVISDLAAREAIDAVPGPKGQTGDVERQA